MSTHNGDGATMLLGIGEKTFEVELYDTCAGRELLANLPQTISMSRWGDEFYGTLHPKIGHAGDTLRDVFEIGEVAMCVFCKREILKVAKIFPQQGGGEFCHPSLRIRESLTRLLGPSNSSR